MTDYFVGLDISQKSTSICVTDSNGKRLHEGAALSRPQDIYGWLSNRIDLETADIRVGLEAGTLSAWLHRGLSELGLQLTMLETFQAHRFLATFRNKTDKNDAHGLAQLLRMGGEDFLRVVKVRSIGAQETRTMLSIRYHLVTQKVSRKSHSRHFKALRRNRAPQSRQTGVLPQSCSYRFERNRASRAKSNSICSACPRSVPKPLQ